MIIMYFRLKKLHLSFHFRGRISLCKWNLRPGFYPSWYGHDVSIDKFRRTCRFRGVSRISVTLWSGRSEYGNCYNGGRYVAWPKRMGKWVRTTTQPIRCSINARFVSTSSSSADELQQVLKISLNQCFTNDNFFFFGIEITKNSSNHPFFKLWASIFYFYIRTNFVKCSNLILFKFCVL